MAKSRGIDTEDTIFCLTVQWMNKDGSLGVATYTASWIAPPADVHSQQRFFYMGAGAHNADALGCRRKFALLIRILQCMTEFQDGEIRIDQAHRGYSMSSDAAGFSSCNPLFMKYTPAQGRFVGQGGYGYRGIAEFVRAANALNGGTRTLVRLLQRCIYVMPCTREL